VSPSLRAVLNRLLVGQELGFEHCGSERRYYCKCTGYAVPTSYPARQAFAPSLPLIHSYPSSTTQLKRLIIKLSAFLRGSLHILGQAKGAATDSYWFGNDGYRTPYSDRAAIIIPCSPTILVFIITGSRRGHWSGESPAASRAREVLGRSFLVASFTHEASPPASAGVSSPGSVRSSCRDTLFIETKVFKTSSNT
jgi:hypothetical protein